MEFYKRKGEIMSYDYYYGDYYTSYFDTAAAVGIAALLALVAGVVLYFTFFNKKNEGKYTGAKEKIYNFMNFNRFYLEDLMKFMYIVSVCVVSAAGIALIILGSFLSGLIIFAVGNIGLRISFELVMMFIIMCRKSVSMDKKLEGIAKYYDDGYDEYCGGQEENDAPSWEADLEEAMSCGGACGSCNIDCDSREEGSFEAEEDMDKDIEKDVDEKTVTLVEVEKEE